MKRDPFDRGEYVGAQQTHNAQEFVFPAQQLQSPRPVPRPIAIDVFVEPLVKLIERIAPIPVDGRIVAAASQVGIERPECACQTEAVLRHRLGEVTARW